MTETQSTTPAPIPLRPETAAIAAILLLFAADLLYMIESLFQPVGVDLGFTQDNVIYLLVRSGLVATAVLVAGATALGRRWLLVTAGIVAGVHTLTVFGMAVVQLVLGARGDFIVETVLLLLCLVAILAAFVLGFVAARRNIVGLRWAGVLIAAGAAAVWSISWFLRPFGAFDLPAAALPFILLEVVLTLLVVHAAGFVGMRSTALRYAAFGMAALLAVWQLTRLPEALGVVELLPGFLVLRAVLLIGAAVAAFVAARAIRPVSPGLPLGTKMVS